MNWKRVLIFIAVIFAATAAVSFPFGFAMGILTSQGRAVPEWLPIAQGGASILAATSVFTALAMRQLDRTWEHAWAVWAGAQAASLPLNVGFLGMTPTDWAIGAAVFLIPLFFGVSLGQRLQQRRTG